MSKKYSFFLVVLAVVYSCNLSDKTEALVDNMYYVQESSDYNFILFNRNMFLYSNVYEVENYDTTIVFFQEIDVETALQFVVKAPLFEGNIDYKKKLDSVIKNNKMFKKQVSFDGKAIWVFQKKNKKLLGPFALSEYENLKKEYIF